MTKQIEITTRAIKKTDTEEWIEEGTSKRPSSSGQTKRLTIDIDAELHRALKMHCAQHDRQIADLIRQLIVKEIGHSPAS